MNARIAVAVLWAVALIGSSLIAMVLTPHVPPGVGIFIGVVFAAILSFLVVRLAELMNENIK